MRTKTNPMQRKATSTKTIKKVRSSTLTSTTPHVQITSFEEVIKQMQELANEKRRTGNYPKMIKTTLLDLHQWYYHGCLIKKAATALNFVTLQRLAGSYVSALRRIHELDYCRDLNPDILEQVDEEEMREQENVLNIEWHRANNKPKPLGKSKETDQKKEGKGESSKEKPRSHSKTGPQLTIETDADEEEKGDEEVEEPEEEEEEEEGNGETDVEDNEKGRKKTSKKVKTEKSSLSQKKMSGLRKRSSALEEASDDPCQTGNYFPIPC